MIWAWVRELKVLLLVIPKKQIQRIKESSKCPACTFNLTTIMMRSCPWSIVTHHSTSKLSSKARPSRAAIVIRYYSERRITFATQAWTKSETLGRLGRECRRILCFHLFMTDPVNRRILRFLDSRWISTHPSTMKIRETSPSTKVGMKNVTAPNQAKIGKRQIIWISDFCND